MDPSRRNKGKLGMDSLVHPLPPLLKVCRPDEPYRLAKDIFPICLDKSWNSTKTKQDRRIHKIETWAVEGLPRWESCLPWEYEELSSDPQYPCKAWARQHRPKLPCCREEGRKGGCYAASLAKAGQVLCLNRVGMKRTHEVEFWLPHPHIQGANKEIYLKFLSLFLFFFQEKKKKGKPGQLPNQFQAWDGGWWTNGQLW